MDRLESILRRFQRPLFHGPGASLLRDLLTPAADVGLPILADDVAGYGADTIAPAAALPFAGGAFDLYCSVMALHAVNDLPGALREAARVLEPDGLFIAVFPGERTLFELREVLGRAETAVTGRLAPRVAPFVAVRDGGTLLQHAGLALPVADVATTTVTYRDPARLFGDLRGAGETSALAEGPRGALRRDVIAEAMRLYAETYPAPGGGISVTVDLVTLTGWKPHPRQPKPLEPGSGRVSLAEAIKAGGPSDN